MGADWYSEYNIPIQFEYNWNQLRWVLISFATNIIMISISQMDITYDTNVLMPSELLSSNHYSIDYRNSIENQKAEM